MCSEKLLPESPTFSQGLNETLVPDLLYLLQSPTMHPHQIALTATSGSLCNACQLWGILLVRTLSKVGHEKQAF